MLEFNNLKSVLISDNPFRGEIHGQSAKPLVPREDHRGDVCLVSSRSYGLCKLRLCETIDVAKNVEYTFNKVPHMLPAFFGRDGRYILTNYLEGWHEVSQSEFLDRIREIGKMCAEINQAQPPRLYSPTRKFLEKLKELNNTKLIDRKLAKKIHDTYIKLTKRTPVGLYLDLSDIHRRNFMSNSSELLIVDGDSIKTRIRGSGFPGLRRRIGPDNWQLFLEGYTKVSKTSFITEDYEKILELTYSVRKIVYRSKHKTDLDSIPRLISSLEQVVNNK